MRKQILLGVLALLLSTSAATAAQSKADVFKGKLFPPNLILQHQDALQLSKEQFTAIRAAVVEVQANVAAHEWDLREAYMNVMSELDKSPVDERRVMEFVDKALVAENQVKKEQVAMLIRLRNLLTDEQVAYLEAQHGAKGGD
jgi:Spy/CpxP family protein refolding chaperone